MATATDDTAHLDGFRVAPSREGGRVRVLIRLYAGGEPCPDLFPDFVLLDGDEKHPGAEAAQEAALVLAQGMCTFMNAGAGKDALFLLTDKFCQAVPDVVPRYKLESVLPPAGGPMYIWRKPDGTFLKVQDGDEGFSEILTERERIELLGAQARPADNDESDESDWPG